MSSNRDSTAVHASDASTESTMFLDLAPEDLSLVGGGEGITIPL